MKKTMRKSASVTTLALVAAFALADPVRVTVNGDPVSFRSAQPEMIQGRVLVPLRGVFEAMGATVDWDPSTQTVMADGNGHHIRLKIGSLDANVNGHVETMDVPARIFRDTTMVPLRFLSESLGAAVDWRPENDLVAIVTHDEGAAQRIVPEPEPPPVVVTPPPTIIIEKPAPPTPPPPPPPPPYVITGDTVIPLRLDQQVSSNDNHPGDRVTATVRGDAGRYLDLPDGTVIEGRVREAVPASGSHGGTLQVRFTHIRFPDGSTYPIKGVVTRPDQSLITKTDNGRLVANSRAERFIGKNAPPREGADLVLGPAKGKVIGGSAVGGSFGAFVGVFDHRMAHNVIVPQGERLVLILGEDLAIDRHDIKEHGNR